MSIHGRESLGGEAAWLVQHELASLEQAYATGEAVGAPAHCLVGTEIDFALYMNKPTPEQIAALTASRAAIKADLSLLVPQNEEQAQRKANWLRQIPQLSYTELINYHIYRRLSVPTLEAPTPDMYLQADDSPETTLEFVFGNGLYQTGYYDNPGMFEMRTQAAKPTIAMERITRAVTVADEVARSFGAIFTYKGDHTNFSVWTPGEQGLRPVHALDTPEGQDIASKATAGILHALRDSRVMLRPPSVFSFPSDRRRELKAEPERGGVLRVLPDRFEQRLTVEVGNHALSALVLMAGFRYGVTDPSLDTSFVHQETQRLLVPAEGYHKTRDLYLLRALQQSIVAEGRFIFQGVDELNIHRAEGMLSSIIGAEVYGHGNASYAIGRLLGCISLDAAGNLQADEQAFEQAVQQLRYRHITLETTPKETITERLRRIKCLQHTVTIRALLTSNVLSGVDFHRDLEALVVAPSLMHISTHTLEAVSQDRAAAFTHEEAVARYYCETALTGPAPVAEKIARVKAVKTEFPGADAEVVLQLICTELQRSIAGLTRDIAAYEARPQDPEDRPRFYRYEHWKERYADDLALLQALSYFQ